ncbi:hypothetical protein L7F22_002690 [Adiantum nelumboides]|nr:hypothetical protein [Adiantum nelumboides]
MTVAVGTPSARYSRRTSSDRKALEDMIMAVRRDMEAEIQQAAAAMCSQLDDLRKENQQLRDDLRRTKEEMGLLQAHVREIREDGELPQEAFLHQMSDLGPDLCITASYGNILPKRFLKIPVNGTVNIHPSLLPLYRGAAPVQRTIEDGAHETGVTVAFTVRALDAGPIIASKAMRVDDHIKAPELLHLLFQEGVQLLLRELPSILNGTAAQNAQEQDPARATHAPKVTVDEAWLNFDQPARVLHNKVRAFADWPGTKAKFQVVNTTGEATQDLDLKIITTKPRIDTSAERHLDHNRHLLRHEKSALLVFCGGDSVLEILELQPPGKRIMSAKDFSNGLRGQQLRIAV